MNLKFELALDDIDELVQKLHELINNKDVVVLLRGDLASGKTTFVQNYIKFSGLNECVTSPTFSIQTVYGEKFFHYDIYNKTLEDFVSLGLLEEFEKSGIHFVEWGDDRLEKILLEYGFEVINIKIEKLNNKRFYEVYA